MQTETIINSNGSHWAGESPDGLEELYKVLQAEPLDPDFEKYGNFVYRNPAGSLPRPALRFWGNFFTVSHVFSIDTNDASVIATLIALIRNNQASVAYKDARRQRQEQAKSRIDDQRRAMARRR